MKTLKQHFAEIGANTNLNSYVYVLVLDNRMYTVLFNKIFKIGCHALYNAKGLRNEPFAIYAVPKEYAKRYKITGLNKYYNVISKIDEMFNVFFDITSFAEEFASSHDFMDFALIKWQGGRGYMKVYENEFDEAIRLLERNGHKRFKVAHVREELQKRCLQYYDAKIGISHLINLDESQYDFQEYTPLRRVNTNQSLQEKNGYILFVKQNNVDRFLLCYHTTKGIEINESIVIRNNQEYNSFIQRVLKRKGGNIIKMVAFHKYTGAVNDTEYTKIAKKNSLQLNWITDYECTDILSHAIKSEVVQVIDNSRFF